MPLTLVTVLSLAIALAAIFIVVFRGRGPVGDAGRVQALEQALATEQAARQQAAATVVTREASLLAATHEIRDLSMRASGAVAEVAHQAATIRDLRGELAEARSIQQGLLAEQQRLNSELAGTLMELRKEKENGQEKLNVLSEAREQLTHQFRSLANDILEEKSQRFAEQNKDNLNQLLLPLKEQLTGFKTTVERVYVEEGKERSALAEQVKQLHALNAQLSADATGLTNALKGSTKAQGNWGEVVLERILESGGLRRDHEYRVQESHTREDGTRAIPDVILHLPEGRHLIIDAKVSMLDYNDHVNGLTEEQREASAGKHLNSLRTHFRGLSEKDYRSLHSLNTVDFVIMFVPIEPAFMLGIHRDPNLWTQAWEKNILLVSPSTLLFVVRTVSHIWKQEQQRNQWQEIARQGGDLYDKFSAFVGDLTKLGEQLDKTKASYDLAFNKLKSGRGNLINRADSLRRMGLKVVKPLPANLVDAAAEAAGEDPAREGEARFSLATAGEGAASEPGPLLLDLAPVDDPLIPRR